MLKSYNRNVKNGHDVPFLKTSGTRQLFLQGAQKVQTNFNNAFRMFVHQFVIWLCNRNFLQKYWLKVSFSKQTMCPNEKQCVQKSNVSQALIFSSCFRKDVMRGEYQHLFGEHNRAGRNRHQALSGSISKHERKKIVHIIVKVGKLTFQNETFTPRFPRWLSTILLFFINFSELRHVLSRWRDSSLYTKQEKQSGALKTQDHKSTGENTSSLHRA